MNSGIPVSVRNLTDNFNYGDTDNIEKKIKEHHGNIAAIILEPAGASNLSVPFLQSLRQICNREGIVLIFDEIISGFRYALGGVQEIAKVTPDLSTFGKAVANGYPLSILVGRKEVMEIGGIKHNRDRVFLMSSTFGPERSGLAAAIWTINQLQKNNRIETNWEMAEQMKHHFNEYSFNLGLQDRVCMDGDAINPLLKFVDENGGSSPRLRATFLYETVEEGLLMNYIALSVQHRAQFWKEYREKIEASLNRVKKRIDEGKLEEVGIEPVFRRKN
jgi:glutamate-1-semialdehyde 2,1-aminomutase